MERQDSLTINDPQPNSPWYLRLFIGLSAWLAALVLGTVGVHLAGVTFDTMVASYLLDAGTRNHNLDELARRYLDHTNTKISDLIGKG